MTSIFLVTLREVAGSLLLLKARAMLRPATSRRMTRFAASSTNANNHRNPPHL